MPDKTMNVRNHLQRYIMLIGDAATKNESLGKYEKMLESLNQLAEITEEYYWKNEEGKMPALKKEDITKIHHAYKEVLKNCNRMLTIPDNQLKGVNELVNELSMLLSLDEAALDVVSPDKNMTLTEILENGRAVTVDIGNQSVSTTGNQMSSRIPLHIEGSDNVIKKGFFTKNSFADPLVNRDRILAEFRQKYPDMSEIFDHIETCDRQTFGNAVMGRAEGSIQNKSDPNVAKNIAYKVWKNSLNMVNVPGTVADKYETHPQYPKMMMELTYEMEKQQGLYITYIEEELYLHTDADANIDKRNAAMSAVTSLVGKPNLLAKSETMILMQNGKAVSGTFMENAEGSDIFNMKGDDELLAYRKVYGPYNRDLYRDLANLQVLDYICGNVDRHEGNMLYKTTRENGKLKINGLVGIDNDASFPERDFYEQEFQFHDEEYPHIFKPENFRYVNRETADIIRNMNRAQLESVLRGHNISKEAIDRAWNRTLEVKDVLEKMSEKNIQYVDEIIDGKTNPFDPQNPFHITDDIKKNPSIFSGFDHRIEREINREKMKDNNLQSYRKMNDELLIADDDGAELKAFKDQTYEARRANAAEYKDATRQQALIMDFHKIEKMNSIMKRINRIKSPSKEFIQMRDAMNTIAEHAKRLKVSVSQGGILHGSDYETYKDELDKLNTATKNYINEKGMSPRTEAGKERLKGAMSLDNKLSDLLISFEAGKKLETPELDNAVKENNYLDEFDEHLL